MVGEVVTKEMITGTSLKCEVLRALHASFHFISLQGLR